MKSLQMLKEQEILLNQQLFNKQRQLALLKQKHKEQQKRIENMYRAQNEIINQTDDNYNEILQFEGAMNTIYFRLKDIKKNNNSKTNVLNFKKEICEVLNQFHELIQQMSKLINLS